MTLEIDAVTGGYGAAQVLHGVSLRIARQEQVGLFGPNGHGKTTLLRMVSGLLAPWSGTVRYDDRMIGGLDPTRILDLGIVHVPQANTLFPRMTIEENLLLGAYSRRTWPDRRRNVDRVFTVLPKLADRRRQRAHTLSGGERQMVAIGIGLMGEPRLLLLDEPTLGLAPKVKDELASAIGDITRGGVGLLLVDQDVEFLVGLTDRLCLLEQGAIVFETESRASLDHEEIMALYFGTTGSRDAR